MLNTLIILICWWVFLPQPSAQKTEASLVSVVKSTLAINPIIQRNTLEVERRKADIQNQMSVFDLRLRGDIGYNAGRNNLIDTDPDLQFYDNIKLRRAQWGAGIQKTFKNSLMMDLGTNWSRFSDSSPFDEFDQDQSPYLSSNKGNILLNLTQPLLQGKGRKVAMAYVEATSKIKDAQETGLIQLSADEVLNVINQYWQYVGAYQSVLVYEENENRVLSVLEMTSALIEADKKPRAELVQVRADLAEKENLTISAKQNLFLQQQELQRVIGLDERVVLADPSDDFPTPDEAGFTSSFDMEVLYSIALSNRMDLKALEINQSAILDQLIAIENNQKPILDLGGSIEYGGFSKGNNIDNLLTLFGKERGRAWSAGLSLNYLFPLQNNRAKSELLLQNIAVQDQMIILENERRNIKININIAVNNLKQSYAGLLKSKEAYNLFQEAFSNEQESFQNGLTTLINVILFQERLTFAELQYIDSKQKFAIDLAVLRYQTGTLINANLIIQEEFTSDQFYKIPGT